MNESGLDFKTKSADDDSCVHVIKMHWVPGSSLRLRKGKVDFRINGIWVEGCDTEVVFSLLVQNRQISRQWNGVGLL